MNSYIDIYLTCNGKRFPAKFYGDKIVSAEADCTIARKDILGYKINFISRKIYLNCATIGENIFVTYHDLIVSWLDPLFKVRSWILGFIVVLPVAISSFFFGISLLLPAVLFSVVTGLFAGYFFKIIQADKDDIYIQIILLMLFVCAPVMYWYPFSIYIFAGGISFILIFVLIQLVYPSTLNMRKYYFGMVWFLLILFLYFWLIAVFKLWGDYNIYRSAKGLISESRDGGEFAYQNIAWVKPVDWQISPYNFFTTLIARKSMLWQISPEAVQFKISTPDYPEFGWLAVSKSSPNEALLKMNAYLDTRKNILMADLLSKTEPVSESMKFGKMTLQSFTFYDMIERRVSSIHVVFISEQKNPESGTLIFAFKIPESASLNYYLDLVRGGIKLSFRSITP